MWMPYGEDCFQSLDEALARGPTPARRSWGGRLAANGVDPPENNA